MSRGGRLPQAPEYCLPVPAPLPGPAWRTRTGVLYLRGPGKRWCALQTPMGGFPAPPAPYPGRTYVPAVYTTHGPPCTGGDGEVAPAGAAPPSPGAPLCSCPPLRFLAAGGRHRTCNSVTAGLRAEGTRQSLSPSSGLKSSVFSHHFHGSKSSKGNQAVPLKLDPAGCSPVRPEVAGSNVFNFYVFLL